MPGPPDNPENNSPATAAVPDDLPPLDHHAEEFDISGRLPTINENEAENEEDSNIIESWYAELMDERTIEEDPTFVDWPIYPVQMMAENEVLFTALRKEWKEETFLGVQGNMHTNQAETKTEPS